MYCSTCGKVCVVPEGYEGDRGFGTITNKETGKTKVIRCVECVNKHGMDDLIFVCVATSRKHPMPIIGGL